MGIIDLQEDPMEMNNLYGKQDMRISLINWKRSLYVYKNNIKTRMPCRLINN